MRFALKFILGVAAVVALFLLLISLASCEVLKHKRTSLTDSTSIHRVDTVRITTKDSGSKSEATWFREILNYLPQGHDTVINHTTVPVNNYYPSQIIREGGSMTREDFLHMTDSMNAHRVDTTHVAAVVETKDKKTTVMPWWSLVLIAIGGFILAKVVRFQNPLKK